MKNGHSRGRDRSKAFMKAALPDFVGGAGEQVDRLMEVIDDKAGMVGSHGKYRVTTDADA